MKRAYVCFSLIFVLCIFNPFTVENSFPFSINTKYTIAGDVSTKLGFSSTQKGPGQSYSNFYKLDYEAVSKATSAVSHVFTGNNSSENFQINCNSGSGGLIQYFETMSRSVQNNYSYTFPFNYSLDKFYKFGTGRSFFSGNALSLISQYNGKRGIWNLDSFGNGNFGITIGKSTQSGASAEKVNFNLEMDGEFTIEGSFDFFDESPIKILGNRFSVAP